MEYAKLLERRNKLLTAIHQAFTDWAFKDHDDKSKTYCNMGAHQVAQTLGCKDFYSEKYKRPMLANEIYEFLSTSKDWGEIKMAEAQGYANEGYFVVAVDRGIPSGHVATVCPGLEQKSESRGMVPALMNVGASNFIGKKMTLAFSQIPKFYLWRAGI